MSLASTTFSWTGEEYQQQGSVIGFDSKSLREANELVSSARKDTPISLRHLFRSGVRHDSLGYDWYWILL